MKAFVCGFMERESQFLMSNAACDAGQRAAACHHTFIETGSNADFDAFMDALVQWRSGATYPFVSFSEAGRGIL